MWGQPFEAAAVLPHGVERTLLVPFLLAPKLLEPVVHHVNR
jgi:hypothetical protein